MIQTKRKGLIVWVYSLKQVNHLKKFGTVYYQSKQMNYVLLYVDDVNVEEKIAKIKRLHFVRFVDVSHLDEIDMSFKDALRIEDDVETLDLIQEEQS